MHGIDAWEIVIQHLVLALIWELLKFVSPYQDCGVAHKLMFPFEAASVPWDSNSKIL